MPIGSNDGVDFFCGVDYNKGERVKGRPVTVVLKEQEVK